MAIIDHPEYETELKELHDSHIEIAGNTFRNDLIVTIIIFLITITTGAYLKLPDALLISIVIAVACVCFVFIFLERLLALTLAITFQTATIEWIGRKQYKNKIGHPPYIIYLP